MPVSELTYILLSSFFIFVILPLFIVLFSIGSFVGTFYSLRQEYRARSHFAVAGMAAGLVVLKIIFLLVFFIAMSRLFSWLEGDLFTFSLFMALVAFGSFLERSTAWWAGGIIGYFCGVTIGFAQGFFWTGILWMLGLGVLGLALDYVFSKRYIE